MSSFTRFQKRNQLYKTVEDIINTEFILKGYPSIQINNAAGETITAAVVNKQEKDMAYVYTQIDNALPIGSVWKAKNLPLLITEEITIIKDVQWHKYIALICNFQLDNIWGYFYGPEKKHVKVSLEGHSEWFSAAKPVLVLPSAILGFNDKIVIKGRAWLVEEYDDISSEYVTYYSLRPTTVSKQIAEQHVGEECYIEYAEVAEPTIPEGVVDVEGNIMNVANNSLISIETENGYFISSNKNIQIKQHTTHTVSFILPFGVTETTIQIQEKGEIKELIYRVV